MLKVVLMFFFFILLAEHASDTILLLRQLVFFTYTFFGTLKIVYGYGRVNIGSDGHGFDSHHRRSYFSVLDILNYKFHDIFSILICHRVIDFIYIFYNRQSCTNPR